VRKYFGTCPAILLWLDIDTTVVHRNWNRASGFVPIHLFPNVPMKKPSSTTLLPGSTSATTTHPLEHLNLLQFILHGLSTRVPFGDQQRTYIMAIRKG